MAGYSKHPRGSAPVRPHRAPERLTLARSPLNLEDRIVTLALKRPHRIVIALGGNALGNSTAEEMERIDKAVPSLVGLARLGNEIIITHGNGPQVGMVQNVFEIAHDMNPANPTVDLSDAVALTQGFIGYHLQQGLTNELIREHLPWQVATVVTTIEVDANDPAFEHPEKPIGRFLSDEEIREAKIHDHNLQFMEDSGRGCRRAVASPDPKRIVEADSIVNLIDSGYIAIACGGGGVPVVRDKQGCYHSIPCVLDKDLASELLAEDCDADMLFLLTAVDYVAINFGTPEQRNLKEMTVPEAERYLKEGQFGKGSMKPKVEAAIRFVKSKPGRECVIASLESAPLAMHGKSGTLIHR